MLAKRLEEEMERGFFTNEDQRDWNTWMNFQSRNWKDLHELLSGDYRNSIKERALAALLSPQYEILPFFVSSNFWIKSWCNRAFIKDLSPELLARAAQFIKIFQGEAINNSCRQNRENAIYYYNHCIMDMLHYLPEQHADDLLEYFHFGRMSTDLQPWEVLFTNFFALALENSNISTEWKKKIDNRMRNIVRTESKDGTKVEFNYIALNFYVESVKYILTLKTPMVYDRDFLASQLEFILDVSEEGKYYPMDCGEFFSCFHMFYHKNNRAFLQKVVRYMVLRNCEGIVVDDVLKVKKAREIINNFSKDNPEIIPILEEGVRGAEELMEKKALVDKQVSLSKQKMLDDLK